MTLIKLAERAQNLGFNIHYKNGIQLVPVTQGAQSMLSTQTIECINTMQDLTVILTLLEIAEGAK